jgi:uncharacterized protein DUF4412
MNSKRKILSGRCWVFLAMALMAPAACSAEQPEVAAAQETQTSKTSPPRKIAKTAKSILTPQTPFKADMKFRFGDNLKMEGAFWYDDGLERREMSVEGQNMTMITRPDKNEMYSLFAGTNMAMRSALTPEMQYLNTEWMSTLNLNALGKETISGEKTTKYQVDGDKLDGFVWVTRDGVVMKIDGRSRDSARGDWAPFTIEMENLQRGPIDPQLFEIPPGLQIMDATEFYGSKLN